MDARRATGDEREERLGHAHVRVHLEGGVLDSPDHVEAELLGEERLLHDLVQDLCVTGSAGVVGLRFVDEGELHAGVPFGWLGVAIGYSLDVCQSVANGYICQAPDRTR